MHPFYTCSILRFLAEGTELAERFLAEGHRVHRDSRRFVIVHPEKTNQLFLPNKSTLIRLFHRTRVPPITVPVFCRLGEENWWLVGDFGKI